MPSLTWIVFIKKIVRKSLSVLTKKLKSYHCWYQKNFSQLTIYVISQYQEFRSLAKSDYDNDFRNFIVTNDRLDDLFVKMIREQQYMEKLWSVVKILLVLLHGQGIEHSIDVEKGFSTSREVLPNIMQAKSIISNRIAVDACTVRIAQNTKLFSN